MDNAPDSDSRDCEFNSRWADHKKQFKVKEVYQ